MPDLGQKGFFEEIENAINRLEHKCESFLHKLYNNIAESCTAVMCKLDDEKRVDLSTGNSYEIRCVGTVVQFNLQNLHSSIALSMSKVPYKNMQHL